MLQKNGLLRSDSQFPAPIVNQCHALHQVPQHLPFKGIPRRHTMGIRQNLIQFLDIVEHYSRQKQILGEVGIHCTSLLSHHHHPLHVVQQSAVFRTVLFVDCQAELLQLLILKFPNLSYNIVIHAFRIFRRRLVEIGRHQTVVPVGVANPGNAQLLRSLPLRHSGFHLDDIAHLDSIDAIQLFIGNIPFLRRNLSGAVRQCHVQIFFPIGSHPNGNGLHHEKIHKFHIRLQLKNIILLHSLLLYTSYIRLLYIIPESPSRNYGIASFIFTRDVL